MGGQDLLGVVAVEPGMADDRVRKAVGCVDLGQPAGFGDLVVTIALGLDMDRLDHVLVGAVAPEVLGQIVPPDRAILAEKELLAHRVGQERIMQRFEIPQVMVGIDDLQVGHLGASNRAANGGRANGRGPPLFRRWRMRISCRS